MEKVPLNESATALFQKVVKGELKFFKRTQAAITRVLQKKKKQHSFLAVAGTNDEEQPVYFTEEKEFQEFTTRKKNVLRFTLFL